MTIENTTFTSIPAELLVCPKCRHPLSPRAEWRTFHCHHCRVFFPLLYGIPSFSDPEVYWGEEFDRNEMEQINEVAESEGWKKAVDTIVTAKSPSRARYIRDFFRADWRFLFPLQPEWRILDIGAGWGSLSVTLASLCQEVVALDSVLERARFIQTRISQDGIQNVHPIHGNLASPPIAYNYFDLATMNGVLEWLGWSDLSRNTRYIQLEMLGRVFDLLKPGGYLYIGIENRFSISYWLGAMDHSYQRYTSLLPRPLAHLVTHLIRGHTYRTYTYSPIGYRKLLRKVGFTGIDFYGVMPTYSRPINYWPLGDGIPLQRFSNVLFSEKPNGLSWKSRLVQKLVEGAPSSLVGFSSRFLVPHLLIVARKGVS